MALLWTVAFVHILRTAKDNPVLTPVDGDSSESQVSVIVPARNEGSRILRESVLSMLRQEHSATEVIAVNDRSSDDTGEILEEIRRNTDEGRLIIVNGEDPPDGWLGKPNALQQGLRVSKGEWVLITDADIVFAPQAVRTAVVHAERKGYDALTLLPRIDMESFWERVFMPVFGWFALLAMPLHKVNDPSRPETLGVGNFFLIKHSVLGQLNGFEPVRSDVAEDIKFAEVLKKEGFQLRIETAPDLLRTRMYAGLGEIWHGFTKNLFSGLRFSYLKGLSGSVSIVVFGALPVLAAPILFLSSMPLAGGFCLAAYLLQVAAFSVILRNIEQNPVYAAAVPAGFFLFALILMNSMFRIMTGRGVVWKGRSIYESGGIVPPR